MMRRSSMVGYFEQQQMLAELDCAGCTWRHADVAGQVGGQENKKSRTTQIPKNKGRERGAEVRSKHYWVHTVLAVSLTDSGVMYDMRQSRMIRAKPVAAASPCA